MTTETRIKGKRITLRDKRLEDAANDYAWRTDAELTSMDATKPTKLSFQDYLSVYQDELSYPYHRSRRFAIEDATGKHIGNCMYYNINHETSEAELGILIGDRDYWGKGYGSDAVATLVEHIFKETRINRIYLCTLDWNIRAQKCFRKCGFIPCGNLVRDGNTFLVMEQKRNWLKGSSKAQPDSTTSRG